MSQFQLIRRSWTAAAVQSRLDYLTVKTSSCGFMAG
jgi:hypothetical protein